MLFINLSINKMYNNMWGNYLDYPTYIKKEKGERLNNEKS